MKAGQRKKKASRVSSPASTGGAGTFFEQHVAAYWLVHLLLKCIPPILLDCTVVEVNLQTEHLGWNTDDFLIVGENGSGGQRKLAGQVKQTFTVSADNNECKKTIQDFWNDFKNSEHFTQDTDRLALITLRGTNTLLEYFSGLLDCSRNSNNGDNFEHRLTTPGLLNTRARHFYDEIKTIIDEIEGRDVSATEIWPFLRILHVLSLDLNSSTNQTEASMKNLLAYTTDNSNQIDYADITWSYLLREIGEGMPRARQYKRNNLPKEIRNRHALFGNSEQRVLYALNNHSIPILDGIRSTIGNNSHLLRECLMQQVIEQLQSTQVVLISGASGSGKSVIAKDIVRTLENDHFVFSFRAEEFACPHFDETLLKSQVPANTAKLEAILASQTRKVLLIESVERLLEKSTRDAFDDLLTLMKKDNSWHLVLTCRDYSTDLVRDSFLTSAKISHSVVIVSPLDDNELNEIEAANPTLARPLANVLLRRLLSNPYILDKALQIPWSDERPLPQSEMEFRTLFWRVIVRADHFPATGMPLRREETFVQIALRRAKALSLYVPYNGLDKEAIQALRKDSLIVSPSSSEALVAPAHDVLEDWSILRWIEEQYQKYEGSIRNLTDAIGTYPALRRAYRMWVSEFVDRDTVSAHELFQTALSEVGLSAQICDDTLVSLLRATSSATFLERQRAVLFANEKHLLKRVIHLLRVACVTAPTRIEPLAHHASLFNIPDGPAWASVLRLIQTNLPSFVKEDHSLLLGFIEDWNRGVSWQNPNPKGTESVAAIAYWLISVFDTYESNDQLKRTLKVIANIPNTDRECFASLLQGSHEDKKRDWISKELHHIIFDGLEGTPAARDMPEAIISAALKYLLISEENLRREYEYTSDQKLDILFGIKQGRSFNYIPASALHGPFLPLLNYHPREGLEFFITVFNYSVDWYSHPRVRKEHIESPFEIILIFGDGTTKTQWCNSRLWNLYRGLSVGPDVLKSLLMALEHWLLDFAKINPTHLDTLLIKIMRQSDSVALTSVVASIATAFPHSAGETLLVLLRSRWCIQLDRQRRATELPILIKFRNDIYEEERKLANALPHRQNDLEIAILNLQLGPLASRVHEVLDRHHAEISPIEEKDEEYFAWRLALQRMDIRQYKYANKITEISAAAKEHTSSRKYQPYASLELKTPEPDVKEFLDKKSAKLQTITAQSELLKWGDIVFNYEENSTYYLGQWQKRLQEAQTIVNNFGVDEIQEYSRGGPGIVAAVCVRDHWEEMSENERNWCIDRICSEVEQQRNHWNQYERVQKYILSADRPCAWVLPLLLGKKLSKSRRYRVRQTLTVAITHAIDEVRWYTASGIGEHLWTIDRDMTMRCINAIATEATMIQQAEETEIKKETEKKRQIDKIEAEVAAYIRMKFYETDTIAVDAYQKMVTNSWFGAEANGRVLTILEKAPTEVMTIPALERLTRTLVEWWDADDNRHRDQDQKHLDRNDETESALTNSLVNLLLRINTTDAIKIITPIVDAIEHHPDKVQWVLMKLVNAENRQPNTQQFWALWEKFAEGVRKATWITRIHNDHPSGSEMISAIFLVPPWKKDIRYWKSLEGYAWHLDKLFEQLPASSTVLINYLRFLYYIGEHSLPEAFIYIGKRIQKGNPQQMLRKENNIFLLEVLLQQYVYRTPLKLKRNRSLRESVLFLLDLLIENGSSASFRMRDDFVTPISTTDMN